MTDFQPMARIWFASFCAIWALGPAVANAQTGACCSGLQVCDELTEGACTGDYQGNGTTCMPNLCPVTLTPYVDPLPMPAIAQPVVGAPGAAAHYEMRMTRVPLTLHSELPPTTVWSYEGQVPGPTIEARADEEVTVNWIDDLRTTGGALLSQHDLTIDTCIHGAEVPEAIRTVVHLHGAHTFAEFDGHPELWSTPGDPGDLYRYPNGQLPTTMWYHDHALGVTRLNVTMGLAGFYILRDSFEDALGLPSGEFEVPLMVMDRSFNADGSFDYPETYVETFTGDKMIVNGAVWPFMNVKQGKYRLRVLNASNSRHITFNFKDGGNNLPITIIGTDGGLLAAPSAPVNSFTLGPAERTDVIVDFAALSPGTEVLLENSAGVPFPMGAVDLPQIMKFVVQNEAGFTGAIPGTLRSFAPLDITGVPVRTFVLRRTSELDMCQVSRPHWLINGLPWTEGPVDPGIDPVRGEMPTLGSTEIWQFANATGMTHPMHMHLLMFQVLDRHAVTIDQNDNLTIGAPLPLTATEMGWKDTVQVGRFEVVRVAAKFEDFTGTVVDSKPIGFVYHCHILEHEDLEMMRQFNVVTTCGDDQKGPAEECDDGNTTPDDGCSATCTWENRLPLVGLPQGGGVGVTILGQLVEVTTSLGDNASDVAVALAAAIEADPTLMGMGVTAFADGDSVVISDPIDSSSIGDPGLDMLPVITAALEPFDPYPSQTDAQGTDEGGDTLYALRSLMGEVAATAGGVSIESASISSGSWALSTTAGPVNINDDLARADFPGAQDPAGTLSQVGETGPFSIYFASQRDLTGESFDTVVRDSAGTGFATLSLNLLDASGNEVETPAMMVGGSFEPFAAAIPASFTLGDTVQFDAGSVVGIGLTFRSTTDPAPAHVFEIDSVAVPEPGTVGSSGVALTAMAWLAASRRSRRVRRGES